MNCAEYKPPTLFGVLKVATPVEVMLNPTKGAILDSTLVDKRNESCWFSESAAGTGKLQMVSAAHWTMIGSVEEGETSALEKSTMVSNR